MKTKRLVMIEVEVPEGNNADFEGFINTAIDNQLNYIQESLDDGEMASDAVEESREMLEIEFGRAFGSAANEGDEEEEPGVQKDVEQLAGASLYWAFAKVVGWIDLPVSPFAPSSSSKEVGDTVKGLVQSSFFRLAQEHRVSFRLSHSGVPYAYQLDSNDNEECAVVGNTYVEAFCRSVVMKAVGKRINVPTDI